MVYGIYTYIKQTVAMVFYCFKDNGHEDSGDTDDQ